MYGVVRYTRGLACALPEEASRNASRTHVSVGGVESSSSQRCMSSSDRFGTSIGAAEVLKSAGSKKDDKDTLGSAIRLMLWRGRSRARAIGARDSVLEPSRAGRREEVFDSSLMSSSADFLGEEEAPRSALNILLMLFIVVVGEGYAAREVETWSLTRSSRIWQRENVTKMHVPAFGQQSQQTAVVKRCSRSL